MNVGARNHLASICYTYVKRQHPEDFELLKELATTNYSAHGPIYTIPTVLEQFKAKKLGKETT